LAERLGLTEEQSAGLERYAAALVDWNRKINLVSRKSLEEDFWQRHMLDSAQLLAHLPPAPAGRALKLADLGSGGGFPGLVLAILGAGEVHLVESDGRKAAFLTEVSRETGCGARVHVARIEALAPLAADCVTARALAPLPKLLGYVARHLKPGGRALLLKGRDRERELTEARREWSMRMAERPSLSDPEGRILVVDSLARKRGSTAGESRRA